jgi:hypothetical protein
MFRLRQWLSNRFEEGYNPTSRIWWQDRWRLIRHKLRWHTIQHMLMGKCRVCGAKEEVLCYDPRSILYYFVRKTYCPEHCPDHYYVYERAERHHFCETCGKPADPDWYAERF